MAHIQAAAPTATGILDSLKGYLSAWVSLLKTRVEIISTELEEEKGHLQQLVLLALIALICFSFGIILLTSFVVVLLWDYRLAVLGGFTALYLVSGAAIAMLMRKKIKSKPKLFASTLEELRKDQQHLS